MYDHHDKIALTLLPGSLLQKHKLDDRGMRGAPDWIAEVLSPSTATYDRTTKLPVYERAGVPEIWLVDPIDRTVTIYRIAYGQYTQPVVLQLRGKTPITAVARVSIDCDHLLAQTFVRACEPRRLIVSFGRLSRRVSS
jgi:hypothetical protein